jgi:hypothetical protein
MVELGIADEVAPEDDAGLAQALTRALDQARPGERLARLDRATARWLR